MTPPNPASIASHRRFGFAALALLHQVGRESGRHWSPAWCEKRMD